MIVADVTFLIGITGQLIIIILILKRRCTLHISRSTSLMILTQGHIQWSPKQWSARWVPRCAIPSLSRRPYIHCGQCNYEKKYDDNDKICQRKLTMINMDNNTCINKHGDDQVWWYWPLHKPLQGTVIRSHPFTFSLQSLLRKIIDNGRSKWEIRERLYTNDSFHLFNVAPDAVNSGAMKWDLDMITIIIILIINLIIFVILFINLVIFVILFINFNITIMMIANLKVGAAGRALGTALSGATRILRWRSLITWMW